MQNYKSAVGKWTSWVLLRTLVIFNPTLTSCKWIYENLKKKKTLFVLWENINSRHLLFLCETW
jgi:hypothetical protein